MYTPSRVEWIQVHEVCARHVATRAQHSGCALPACASESKPIAEARATASPAQSCTQEPFVPVTWPWFIPKKAKAALDRASIPHQYFISWGWYLTVPRRCRDRAVLILSSASQRANTEFERHLHVMTDR